MLDQIAAPCKKGDRIELIEMENDLCPIAPGTRGTVLFVSVIQGVFQITVEWDKSRSLALVTGRDKFRVLPPQHQYTVDVKLFTTVTVTAGSEEEAQTRIRQALDGADANFGAWEETGDPILSTVSVDGEGDLIEIDGEAV